MLLWGHCSFLLGPGAQGSVVPSKFLFPSPVQVLAACSEVNGDLLQEDLCPHPESPSLQQTTADPNLTGDAQTQSCLSLCGVPGSWCAQGLFEPSEGLWREWGLILMQIHPSYRFAGASPLPLDVGYLLTAAPVPPV